jgi:hypothetical protein
MIKCKNKDYEEEIYKLLEKSYMDVYQKKH